MIKTAFQDAWSGFKGWWIPLCLVSTLILLGQSWLPKFLINNFDEIAVFERYKLLFDNALKSSISIGSQQAFLDLRANIIALTQQPDVHQQITMFLYKVMIILLIIGFFISTAHVIIILMAKASSENKSKQGIAELVKKSPLLTIPYILLGFIKAFPFALSLGTFLSIGLIFLSFDLTISIILSLFVIVLSFCIFLFAIFLYVKLYFTGFIITESSMNPIKSIPQSWNLTNGYIVPIAIIFILSVIIDLITGITVVGVIPATGFKYTLRASLYREIKMQKNIIIPKL